MTLAAHEEITNNTVPASASQFLLDGGGMFVECERRFSASADQTSVYVMVHESSKTSMVTQ